MEKQIITFSADEQKLIKTGGIECYASNIVSYIEAHFDLGANWSGYDSVRAVWSNDNNMSVIRNVLVGLHSRTEFKCNPFVSMLRLPAYFECERRMREKAKEILRIVGLEEERNNLSCNLPYGKQRKLEIARALATNPKLLLLDEPAAGMNPHETAELMDIIRKIRDDFDMTILLIEHDMKFVSGLCDELTVLNFGTVLAQGEPSVALNDPEVIKAYIGG